MLQSVKSRAEEKFAAIQKKGKKVLKEKEIAQLERAEHVASLRALRLAKDASLQALRLAKEAADKKAAEKSAAKKKSHLVCPRLTDTREDGEDCD